MNKKVYLILIIIIGVMSVAGYLTYNRSGASSAYRACLDSEGKVVKTGCCKETKDFPNQCLVGACGCSPRDSHQVKTCDCGSNKCFNGKRCIEKSKRKPESNFQEEGNLISQQGEKWILIYEKPGKAALTVVLNFNEHSTCDLKRGKKPCKKYENDYGESGDRVKVIGGKKDGVVEVGELIYVK